MCKRWAKNDDYIIEQRQNITSAQHSGCMHLLHLSCRQLISVAPKSSANQVPHEIFCETLQDVHVRAWRIG